jgi:hypothetical protein
MSQFDEIYDNERIEKDTFRSMRELSKYTKILSKENNLFVTIKKKLQQIKLLSSKSLFKISILLDTLPEENVSFTFYTEEKNEENKDNIIINNFDSKKNDIKKKNNKNKKDGVYIIENIKNYVVEDLNKTGKGKIISHNPSLFLLIWKYLYLINIIISSISFISFCAYALIAISGKEYYLLFSNVMTIFSLCLCIFASNSGYKKIKGKSKVNFRRENIIFICFLHLNIFCGIFWIFSFTKKEGDLEFYVLIIIEIVLGLIDVICAILIWLNIKMVEFYNEYEKLNEEGTPLVEV